MRKIKILAIILIFLFLFAAVSRAETSLKAEVDKTSLTTQEALTYKLTVTSSAKIIPQPKLPVFKGFTVLSNAQTSQISISQGVQKATVRYVFVLAPAAAGKFSIGPSEVEIEGKKYSSDTFEIEVKPGKAGLQQKEPAQKPALPKKTPPDTDNPQFTI